MRNCRDPVHGYFGKFAASGMCATDDETTGTTPTA